MILQGVCMNMVWHAYGRCLFYTPQSIYWSCPILAANGRLSSKTLTRYAWTRTKITVFRKSSKGPKLHVFLAPKINILAIFSHNNQKRTFFGKNETFRKCFFHSAHNSSLNKKVKHKGQSVGLCFYNCINYTANFPMLNRFNDSCLQWRSSIRVSKILIINLWSRARASALCRLHVL